MIDCFCLGAGKGTGSWAMIWHPGVGVRVCVRWSESCLGQPYHCSSQWAPGQGTPPHKACSWVGSLIICQILIEGCSVPGLEGESAMAHPVAG